MIFRFFKILIQIVYPVSFPKKMKDAIQIHLEDSYRDGSFRIFYLFDILISGFRERILSEMRSLRLLWEYDHRSVFGLIILIPWNLFLILIFASLFIGGPGWLKFFHNFPYEKKCSCRIRFSFSIISCGSFTCSRFISFEKEKICFQKIFLSILYKYEFSSSFFSNFSSLRSL
ncbi:hypothetical protein LEP1GSC124_4385 [Leptospira interrogans serovar Pyrogenes str. 200701872]|uniref:Uncharacterized protein n=1 Tax=Leptospira interrogans serovar Pyrogenes str. 200701872 TaxID=1193029 RepID=M6ZX45_LEPIR|nr:hypothetical protein LEP1GSC124_4385 [Leptospira interrogans serovar Pyrogenes str. 200701872]